MTDPTHHARIERLRDILIEEGNEPARSHFTLVRGNYTVIAFLGYGHTPTLEIHAGVPEPFCHNEPLLCTRAGAPFPDNIIRFRENYNARHHGLAYDHFLLTMELTRIFSILIPEHIPHETPSPAMGESHPQG